MSFYEHDEYDPPAEGPRRPPLGLLAVVAGLALLTGLIGGGIAGGIVATLLPKDSQPVAARTTATATPAAPATRLNLTEDSAITQTVQKVLPGVVTLLVEATKLDPAGRVIGRETNLGSGVVIDSRGYIVTNFHVVENAVKITVKFPGGEERPAATVGDDSPFTDIAVIRVQPDNLTVVPMGDSDALDLGQQVLAIGSPAFGQSATDVRNDFKNTVTRGIVSGLHRRWPKSDTVMEDLIQTDAAVNHGNSGGALVTFKGEVVGIPTTVVRKAGGDFVVEGVAFAISSKTFRPLVEEIIQNGKVRRPYLGVRHFTITSDNAAAVGVPVRNGVPVLNNGAAVASLERNGPAQTAGLQQNDIITKIGATDITEENPYLYVLAKLQPNSTVPVTVWRNGRQMTVDVTVGEK